MPIQEENQLLVIKDEYNDDGIRAGVSDDSLDDIGAFKADGDKIQGASSQEVNEQSFAIKPVKDHTPLIIGDKKEKAQDL